MLQIIVDTLGNCCLISVFNNTNIKTKKMNLKSIIDSSLSFMNVDKPVAVVLQVSFDGNSVSFLRIGFGGDKGWEGHAIVVINPDED